MMYLKILKGRDIVDVASRACDNLPFLFFSMNESSFISSPNKLNYSELRKTAIYWFYQYIITFLMLPVKKCPSAQKCFYEAKYMLRGLTDKKRTDQWYFQFLCWNFFAVSCGKLALFEVFVVSSVNFLSFLFYQRCCLQSMQLGGKLKSFFLSWNFKAQLNENGE